MFIVPEDLRAKLQALAAGVDRVTCTAMRDKWGDLYLTGCEASAEEPPTVDVQYKRVHKHSNAEASAGITVDTYVEHMDDWDSPAHRGQCPSAGYGIRVTKVLRNSTVLYDVHVRLLNPELGSVQYAVATLPVDQVHIEGWDEGRRFRLVVESEEYGPFAPENVSFTPFELGRSTPAEALGHPLRSELGVGILPVIAQTDKVATALIVHRAQCPTSGYSIKVTRITCDLDGLISIYVKLSDPVPGSIQSQVITQPVDVVRIEGFRSQWTYRVIPE